MLIGVRVTITAYTANYLEVTMLILTRRVGESLIIADNIIINILSVKGNQIRIGVKAPKEITVHREEIYNRIQSEKVDDKIID